MISMKKNKVILGLSGGVDSTAAALLLMEKGYEVIGMYFSVKEDENELKRAADVASQLGIKFIHKDMSKEFEDIVIGNFCSEYMKGRTPNPCIVCNPNVKFKVLIDTADSEGAYYVATGHYADTFYDETEDMWYIKRAASEKKDQSYMLYRLDRNVISRLLLPLNEMEDKEQVREIAREKALNNSEAKDSQEICFIADDDNYKDFLARRGFVSPEGDFTDTCGNILGKHRGILNYTIGQRKGLGIALGKPAFVTRIDSENNRVVLGDNEELFSCEVISEDNVFPDDKVRDSIAIRKPGGESETVKAKIRYAAKPADANLEFLDDGKIKIIFKEPQRAATPGQSIVFYRGDLVLGGGIIT